MTPPRCLEVLAGPAPARRRGAADPHDLRARSSSATASRASAPTPPRRRDGLIVADVPPDEATSCRPRAARNGIDLVQLISLTSADERLAMACRDEPRLHLRRRADRHDGRARGARRRAPDRPARARARTCGDAAPALRLRRLARLPGARSARSRRRRRRRRLGGASPRSRAAASQGSASSWRSLAGGLEIAASAASASTRSGSSSLSLSSRTRFCNAAETGKPAPGAIQAIALSAPTISSRSSLAIRTAATLPRTSSPSSSLSSSPSSRF